jgi:hypothetical protein
MPRSINRWPVLGDHSADLATGTVPGTNIRLRMRRDVLPLFLALAADWHRQVAPLRKGECGAYDYRQARASSSWSDHSSGTAMDLNWAHEGKQGPRGGMATMTPAQIKAAAALRTKYRVVIWGGDKARGGDYRQPRYWDPMHYALKPGTTVADVKAVIKALGIQPDGTIAEPSPAKPRGGVVTVVDDTRLRDIPSRDGHPLKKLEPGNRIRYSGTRVVDSGEGPETWLRAINRVTRRRRGWVLSKRTTRGA